MSSSVALEQKFKRLPSFAEIKSVDIQKYQKEEKSSDDAVLKQLRDSGPSNPEDPTKSSGLIKSFLYGSPKMKQEQIEIEQSFSQQLMRGKYVHEIVTHRVLPSKAVEYFELVTNVYPKIAADPRNEVHLVGSWRVVVGDMDTYIHIWEYKGYPGFHHTQNTFHEDPLYLDFLSKLRNYVRSRESNLMQEFSFWGGTAAPRKLGGVFELRTYDLQAGRLLEWEQHWKKGIECRRQVMEPVGAWFTQLGSLNRVHHLWQFADLEHRKLSREKCWELPGWAETTHETVKLVDHMQSNILVPLPFSPLK
jgi:hypothetical protein